MRETMLHNLLIAASRADESCLQRVLVPVSALLQQYNADENQHQSRKEAVLLVVCNLHQVHCRAHNLVCTSCRTALTGMVYGLAGRLDTDLGRPAWWSA